MKRAIRRHTFGIGSICLLVAWLLLIGISRSANATPVTYELDNATFSFFPTNSSVLATVDLTGTFVLDPVAQAFVGVEVTLSGLPPAYSLLNDTFNTIIGSDVSGQQFRAVNAPNDDELVLHFWDLFDTIAPNPLLDVTLQCQACPGALIFTQSVTGSADPIPEPGSLGLVTIAVLAWIVLAIGQRDGSPGEPNARRFSTAVTVAVQAMALREALHTGASAVLPPRAGVGKVT